MASRRVDQEEHRRHPRGRVRRRLRHRLHWRRGNPASHRPQSRRPPQGAGQAYAGGGRGARIRGGRPAARRDPPSREHRSRNRCAAPSPRPEPARGQERPGTARTGPALDRGPTRNPAISGQEQTRDETVTAVPPAVRPRRGEAPDGGVVADLPPAGRWSRRPAPGRRPSRPRRRGAGADTRRVAARPRPDGGRLRYLGAGADRQRRRGVERRARPRDRQRRRQQRGQRAPRPRSARDRVPHRLPSAVAEPGPHRDDRREPALHRVLLERDPGGLARARS